MGRLAYRLRPNRLLITADGGGIQRRAPRVLDCGQYELVRIAVSPGLSASSQKCPRLCHWSTVPFTSKLAQPRSNIGLSLSYHGELAGQAPMISPVVEVVAQRLIDFQRPPGAAMAVQSDPGRVAAIRPARRSTASCSKCRPFVHQSGTHSMASGTTACHRERRTNGLVYCEQTGFLSSLTGRPRVWAVAAITCMLRLAFLGMTIGRAAPSLTMM